MRAAKCDVLLVPDRASRAAEQVRGVAARTRSASANL
jgi:hypothetical protein